MNAITRLAALADKYTGKGKVESVHLNLLRNTEEECNSLSVWIGLIDGECKSFDFYYDLHPELIEPTIAAVEKYLKDHARGD